MYAKLTNYPSLQTRNLPRDEWMKIRCVACHEKNKNKTKDQAPPGSALSPLSNRVSHKCASSLIVLHGEILIGKRISGGGEFHNECAQLKKKDDAKCAGRKFQGCCCWYNRITEIIRDFYYIFLMDYLLRTYIVGSYNSLFQH